MNMNVREILENITKEHASDIFVVAGRPLTYKVSGKMHTYQEERMKPDMCRDFVTAIYELADHRDISQFETTVEVPGYTGKTVVTCQIGKYKNSSIRDDMSFINFSDFTNQTEWGQVNTSMLEKVEEAVVKPVYDDLAEGATVNLVGCFTADSNDAIVITPVVLEVK